MVIHFLESLSDIDDPLQLIFGIYTLSFCLIISSLRSFDLSLLLYVAVLSLI